MMDTIGMGINRIMGRNDMEPDEHLVVEHTKLKMEFKVMVCPKCGTPIQAGWTIPRGQWGKVSALFCPNGCWWKERIP